MNVPTRPFQCLLLIKEPNVQITTLSDILAGEKSKCADAIIDLDKYHAEVRFGDDFGSIEVPVRIGSITTTLNEKPDWQFAMWRRVRWRKYIDKETILVGGIA